MWFRNWWLFIRDTEIAIIWDARDTKIASEQTHSRLLYDSEYQLLVESKQSCYPHKWKHCCQLQEKSCNCFSYIHIQKQFTLAYIVCSFRVALSKRVLMWLIDNRKLTLRLPSNKCKFYRQQSTRRVIVVISQTVSDLLLHFK